jgi:hypothetical protein
MTSFGVFTDCESISERISPASIPAFSAILPSTGWSAIHGFFRRNQLSSACP